MKAPTAHSNGPDSTSSRGNVRAPRPKSLTRSNLFVRLSEEQLRRASSLATELIARRFGTHFPMWIGCGFPKSGTVWLCQLMSSYLNAPYAQNSLLPIAMQSIVHAHWAYNPRLRNVAYIVRDGRDVMVSMYFFNMKNIAQNTNPQNVRRMMATYKRAFGPKFDPEDVTGNLPRFIELEMGRPTGVGRSRLNWPHHVDNWLATPKPTVASIRYEDLLANTGAALNRLMTELTSEPADDQLVQLAVSRFSFTRGSGRERGTEDRSSFMRKGVSGDWRNYFSRDAGVIFDHYAGDTLLELGYESDHKWYEKL